MAWSPTQYLKFHAPRLRPALDLLQRAAGLTSDPLAVRSVLDLGCGPGNVTQFLAEMFPNAVVHGVDYSREMIRQAEASNGGLIKKNKASFCHQSIEDCIAKATEHYDVVYSNASLHYLSSHDTLFPKLVKRLVKDNGGVLAVQMSDTRQQPSHLLMETAAARSGVLSIVSNLKLPRIENDASWYYNIVSRIAREVDMWSTDYVQQLESTYEADMEARYHPVLEYTKGTGLLPILHALGGEGSEKCTRYLREYDRLLCSAYPTLQVQNCYHTQGKRVTLMPFKRFFIVCRT